MAEPRECRVMVSVEPSLYDVLRKFVDKPDSRITASTYLRKLLIQDLLERGMITESDIVRITT